MYKIYSLKLSALFLVLSRGLQALSGILLLIILVRIFDKGDMAVYQKVILFSSIGSILFSLGFPQIFYYFLPRIDKLAHRNFILRSLTALLMILLSISTLIWLAVKNIQWLGVEWDITLQVSLILSALLIIHQAILNIFVSVECGIESARQSFYFSIGSFISVVTVTLIFRDIEYSLLMLCGVYLIVCLIGVKKILFIYRKHKNHNICDYSLSEVIKTSIPMWGASISGQMNRILDSVVVLALFTPAVFSVFNMGARELPVVTIVAFNLTHVILPSLVRYYELGDAKSFLTRWHKSIIVSSVIVYPIFAFSFYYAEELVSTLYTDSYIDAVSIFRIYLLLLILRVTAYGQVLNVIGLSQKVAVVAVCGLLGNVAFSFILARAYGWEGPAIVTVFIQVAMVLAMLHFLKHRLSCCAHELLPLRKLLYVVIFSGAALFLTESTLTYLHGELIIWVCIIFPAISTLYVLLLLRFQVIERSYFKGFIRNIDSASRN